MNYGGNNFGQFSSGVNGPMNQFLPPQAPVAITPRANPVDALFGKKQTPTSSQPQPQTQSPQTSTPISSMTSNNMNKMQTNVENVNFQSPKANTPPVNANYSNFRNIFSNIPETPIVESVPQSSAPTFDQSLPSSSSSNFDMFNMNANNSSGGGGNMNANNMNMMNNNNMNNNMNMMGVNTYGGNNNMAVQMGNNGISGGGSGSGSVNNYDMFSMPNLNIHSSGGTASSTNSMMSPPFDMFNNMNGNNNMMMMNSNMMVMNNNNINNGNNMMNNNNNMINSNFSNFSNFDNNYYNFNNQPPLSSSNHNMGMMPNNNNNQHQAMMEMMNNMMSNGNNNTPNPTSSSIQPTPPPNSMMMPLLQPSSSSSSPSSLINPTSSSPTSSMGSFGSTSSLQTPMPSTSADPHTNPPPPSSQPQPPIGGSFDPMLMSLFNSLVANERYKEAADCKSQIELLSEISRKTPVMFNAKATGDFVSALQLREEIEALQKRLFSPQVVASWSSPPSSSHTTFSTMHKILETEVGKAIATSFVAEYSNRISKALQEGDINALLKLQEEGTKKFSIYRSQEPVISPEVISRWESTLSKCLLELEAALTLLKSIQKELKDYDEGDATGSEGKLQQQFFQSPKAVGYIKGIEEMFQMLQRFKLSSTHFSTSQHISVSQLTPFFAKSERVWDDLFTLFSQLNINVKPKSEMSVTLTKEKFKSGVCELCLLPLCVIDIPQLRWGGTSYHSSCANFYCNKVSDTPPLVR